MYRGEEISPAIGGLDANQDKRHAAENHLNGLALILSKAIRSDFAWFCRIKNT